MMKNTIKEIYDIYSVSSFERPISEYLEQAYKGYSYKIVRDKLNSIFFNKENPGRKKVMIAFPLDEYGLMVREIEDNGKVRFVLLEDISPLSFLNQRVNIITRNKENIKGIVKADVKFAENSKTNIGEDDLYIEVLAPRDKLEEKVKIGDLVSLDSPFYEDEDFIMARSLSQKIFQYISLNLAGKIKDKTYPFDLYVGGISQSTIGFRGTKTATYVIKPDLALALASFETNASSPKISLGDGLIVGKYDKQMLPDKKLLSFVEDRFESKSYLGLRGNDGSFIHKTISGTPSLSVGLATANISTANEIVLKTDIEKLETFLIDFLDQVGEFLGE